MYSQLDKKWASVKIGSTNLTMKGYGCTLACLAYASRRGLNTFMPNELALDKVLTNENGEVLWGRVFQKIGGVEKWERRYGSTLPKVEDDQTLLIQVKIGTKYGKHWVVWNGGKTILDPLGGIVRPASDYPEITGQMLITWHKKPTSKLIKSPIKPDVYLYNGKMRFPIPDWETLTFLFGEKSYIAELPQKEVEAIPMGGVVPSMK